MPSSPTMPSARTLLKMKRSGLWLFLRTFTHGVTQFSNDVVFRGKLSYSASVELPAVLQDTTKGYSTSPTQTAFSQSVGRDVSFFDWLSEEIAQPDGSSTPNPTLEVASLAILSAGQASGASLSHGNFSAIMLLSKLIAVSDFPWGSLKDATVVDVGGGLGERLTFVRLSDA